MPKKKVDFSPSFLNGFLNNSEFIDFQHLNQKQLKSVTEFMYKVREGSPLPGKNKPSWLNDNLSHIPHTQSFEDSNYWHYHCGPDYSTSTNISLTINLQMNLNGATSAEIIHYQKIDDDTIIVVGFSPQHNPFKKSDSPYYEHPFFSEEEDDD